MPTQQNPNAGTTRQSGAGSRLTILFVEDQVLVRFSSADLLRGEGHEVIEAANGSEALSLIDAGLEFDLLVSDIRMPGAIDGLELIRLATERHPGLPMLLVSSEPSRANASRTPFLQKPYSDDALLKAVQGAFNRNER